MSRSVSQADLVARALEALEAGERARVDAALEEDAALRQRFEEIAGHLLRYDALPPAPPPPPFERIAEALDARLGDAGQAPDLRILGLQAAGGRRGRRPRRFAAALAAAAVLAGLLAGLSAWAPWRTRTPAGPGEGAMVLVAGPGLSVHRDGSALATPARAARPVAPGDELRCAVPAEGRLGTRVRLVLDGGSRLAVADAARVELIEGRAWFEVEPGAFEVDTPYGAVRVLGTAFEVDVRDGSLAVAVAEGRVDAGGRILTAGSHLAAGQVADGGPEAGAWFRRPRLAVESAQARADGSVRHVAGRPLALRLVFSNPGQVPIVLEGPEPARTALWLRFESTEGLVAGEVPVLSTNVVSGIELLRPGRTARLDPGARVALAVRIMPPFGSPGAYRCKALYRPQGQPAVLSSPLEIEVAE